MAGGGQVAGASRGGQGRGLRDGGRAQVGNGTDRCRGPAGWWAGDDQTLADTRPRGHSLSVSNYDKWPWVTVAG